MEITHRTRNLRVAPRKLRLIIDKVRHMPAEEAVQVVPLVTKRGAVLIQKSIKAAIQAAKDQNLDPKTLVIQRAWCDEGAALKRIHSFSRGRTAPMMKKYSHITLVLQGDAMSTTRRRAKKQAASEAAEQPTEEVSEQE